ncbi:protein of unknown function [uncultured Woeseiaceae bacterium]|uniref:Uncharacterized protein n=1 Tax=uncultured Woeseiaceae bacterium TaxID=1983305 RepID=A0A7D9D1U8_9GAMM|nr:protein of unknown function [uncultured Woeseiaceae bacterium]
MKHAAAHIDHSIVRTLNEDCMQRIVLRSMGIQSYQPGSLDQSPI